MLASEGANLTVHVIGFRIRALRSRRKIGLHQRSPPARGEPRLPADQPSAGRGQDHAVREFGRLFADKFCRSHSPAWARRRSAGHARRLSRSERPKGLAVRLRWIADFFADVFVVLGAGEAISFVFVLSPAGAASFGGTSSFVGSSAAAPSVPDGLFGEILSPLSLARLEVRVRGRSRPSSAPARPRSPPSTASRHAAAPLAKVRLWQVSPLPSRCPPRQAVPAATRRCARARRPSASEAAEER